MCSQDIVERIKLSNMYVVLMSLQRLKRRRQFLYVLSIQNVLV